MNYLRKLLIKILKLKDQKMFKKLLFITAMISLNAESSFLRNEAYLLTDENYFQKSASIADLDYMPDNILRELKAVNFDLDDICSEDKITKETYRKISETNIRNLNIKGSNISHIGIILVLLSKELKELEKPRSFGVYIYYEGVENISIEKCRYFFKQLKSETLNRSSSTTSCLKNISLRYRNLTLNLT